MQLHGITHVLKFNEQDLGRYGAIAISPLAALNLPPA
jgi:hypothetical protein